MLEKKQIDLVSSGEPKQICTLRKSHQSFPWFLTS